MNKGEKPKTSEEYEQLYFPKLEEQNKRSISEIETFTANVRNCAATSQEITEFINRLKEYEKYFLSYEQLAQYLSKAGRPQISKRLNEILNDTRGAIQIFQQMYQNTLNSEKSIFQIQRDVQQYGFNVMKQVTENRQEVFDEANKRWHDVFIGRSIDCKYCPYCGHEIGDYYSYTYCPDCGKKLN